MATVELLGFSVSDSPVFPQAGPLGRMAEAVPRSLYEAPKYYDIVFGQGARTEYEFLRDCFEIYARRPIRRVFEPACGSGRLLTMFARDGYAVSGCDLSSSAVKYCNARLGRARSAATVACGDMCSYRPALKVDAAFNLISSFQHLTSEASAEAHLRTIAQAVARGGLYVFGVQLLPTRGRREAWERWSGRGRSTKVTTALHSLHIDRRRRVESCRLVTRIESRNRILRLSDILQFRTYTAAQMRTLLGRVAQFEVAATYDFSHDICRPARIGPQTQDAIYVLRRVDG